MSETCTNVRDLIPLFPDDLDAPEAALVREHVAGCSACAAELGVYAAQSACFARLRDGREPVDLFSGIQAKLAQEPRGEVVRVSFARRAMFAAAAAGLVAAFTLWAWTHGQPSMPESVAVNPPKAPSPNTKVPGTSLPQQGLATTKMPRTDRPARRHSPRRHFFEQEGATPMPWGGNNGAHIVDEREFVPLDEEAEPVTPTGNKRFAPPPAAHPNPKASDEDQSLRF
jgi:hypothetical protein